MPNRRNLSAKKNSLQVILNSQNHLYDLHTHLMGNGSYEFWIDEILENSDILPQHSDFQAYEKYRLDICPLVWNEEDLRFVDGTRAAKFVNDLITEDFPIGQKSDKPNFQDIPESERKALLSLITDTSFSDKLISLGLSFKENFSYDIVLKLSDLGKGMGVREDDCRDLIQAEVEEKLGISRSGVDQKMPFRHYIVFNARKQHFEIAYGLTAESLRNLIKKDEKAANITRQSARGHIINCFSMCRLTGEPARHIDFHGFHGAFTPEFYPRRFALKDSIYEQRLDILFLLLAHVLKRYEDCRPKITYCELSVGVGDLSRPWVFEILRSIKTPSLAERISDYSVLKKDICESTRTSEFCRLIEQNHFSHLKNKQNTNVTYKFVAGFKRQNVQPPIPTKQREALRLLNEAPHLAIFYMLQEIVQSDKESRNAFNPPRRSDSENVFSPLVKELSELEERAVKMPEFYHWVVGLDLFGDELGYPYCPFVAWPFIQYVLERRKSNRCFGMRIHCGENVVFADNDTGSYRLFVAHMYIVFRCLRYLQRKLKYGIRIGHGVAFGRILGDSMSTTTHRKSSVLLAEIKEHAKYVLPTIAFEVNITSNVYLLRHSICQATDNKTHQLDALFKYNIPIILSTDDDGVWPIVKCEQEQHKKHSSLAAEYCRAISSAIFTDKELLKKAFKNTENFCFFPVKGRCTMPKARLVLPEEDEHVPTIILHPDLIKVVLRQCYKGYSNNESKIQEDPFVKHYSPIYRIDEKFLLSDPESNKLCESMAPLVYIAHCTDESSKCLETVQENYEKIFGTNPDLTSTYNNWINIYKQLIDPNIVERGQHVSLCNHEHVFLSEQPLCEKRVPEHLIDFLQDNYHEPLQINAYARHVNVLETINIIKSQLKRPCHKFLSVILYTNKDKTESPSFSIDQKTQILINPDPSKRTYKNRPQKNTIYVICRHASAATAALNFLIRSLTDADLSESSQPHPTNVTICSEDNDISAKIDISTAVLHIPKFGDTSHLPRKTSSSLSGNEDASSNFGICN